MAVYAGLYLPVSQNCLLEGGCCGLRRTQSYGDNTEMVMAGLQSGLQFTVLWFMVCSVWSC
jgi:hypothetical protein